MTKASKSKDSNIEPYYVYTGSNAVQIYIYIYIYIFFFFFFFFFSKRYTDLFQPNLFLFPLIKLEEINLITLWSEKPCLLDVKLSDYSHRLKNDFISINSCLRDHSFLFSRLSERFLERFSRKIMAAANNFFSLRCRHFVCLHWFIQWILRSKPKSHIVAGEKKSPSCVRSDLWRKSLATFAGD